MYWRWQSKRTLNILEQQVAERTQELALRNKQLQTLSYTDSLTNSFNRHFLFTHIDEYLPQGNFSESTIMCLIDIDHFKQINDSYGHSAGDVVLKSFVKVLKSTIRQNDVVIRWGGEEFLLIMPNISRKAAAEILERIRLNIEEYDFTANNERISVTASFGFTPIPLVHDKSILDKFSDYVATKDIKVRLYKSLNLDPDEAFKNGSRIVTNDDINKWFDAKSIIRDTRALITQRKLKAISNREDIIKSL